MQGLEFSHEPNRFDKPFVVHVRHRLGILVTLRRIDVSGQPWDIARQSEDQSRIGFQPVFLVHRSGVLAASVDDTLRAGDALSGRKQAGSLFYISLRTVERYSKFGLTAALRTQLATLPVSRGSAAC